jgi:hypothetical protein
MLADLEPIQQMRRDRAGDTLKKWSSHGDEKDKAYVGKVFEGLRQLGAKEVAEEVMDLGQHLLR